MSKSKLLAEKACVDAKAKLEKLGIEEKAAELAKFEPGDVKQDFSEWVFGAEKEYTFGKSEETFSKTQVTAAAGIYGSDRLSKFIGIDTDAKFISILDNNSQFILYKSETYDWQYVWDCNNKVKVLGRVETSFIYGDLLFHILEYFIQIMYE